MILDHIELFLIKIDLNIIKQQVFNYFADFVDDDAYGVQMDFLVVSVVHEYGIHNDLFLIDLVNYFQVICHSLTYFSQFILVATDKVFERCTFNVCSEFDE